MGSSAGSEVVCVLDVGKTNAKLTVFDTKSRALEHASVQNASRPGPPYVHLDTDSLWAWLLERLATFSERWQIGTIIATTHGCAPALIDDDGLVLPIPDYEVELPSDVADAYAPIVPPYEETFAPLLPAGHNMGRHVFWLQQSFPELFGRTVHLLGYPQYWAWRLGGTPASEVTYLGAHTHLWAPKRGDFSSLVRHQGWRPLFPPIRPAWARVGRVSRDVARLTGVADDCKILCGLHDSNAAYLRYLRGSRHAFSLVSSGTWMIAFNPSQSLERLDGTRDLLANVDVTGAPIPTARFMGGREYERITGQDLSAAAYIPDVEQIIERRVFALPSFAPGGPFPDHVGQIVGASIATPAERVALATLYVALMTDVALDLLEVRSEVIVDGGFATNELYCSLLAGLRRGQGVSRNLAKEGTSSGASLLAGWSQRRVESPVAFARVPSPHVAGLGSYAGEWRLRVSERRA